MLLTVLFEHGGRPMPGAPEHVPELLGKVAQSLVLIYLFENIVKEKRGGVFRGTCRRNAGVLLLNNMASLLHIQSPIKVNQINYILVLIVLCK